MAKKKTKADAEIDAKENEFYKRHRPKKFKDVLGQDAAVNLLEKYIEKDRLPQTLLLSGDSGCGKTTLGRIIRRQMKCHKVDFVEINGSDKNGIDDMRYIRSQIHKAPFKGDCKIWLIDEAHKISPAAQDMILTMLEDTPKGVYFLLATTDPMKLKLAIRTRCTQIKVSLLSDADLKKIINKVLKKEKVTVSAKVIKLIIEKAEGSGRKALVLLNQIYLLDKEKHMITAIKETSGDAIIEFLGKALTKQVVSWPAVAKILKEARTSKASPETIRWGVLGYATSCLLSGGKISERAAVIIENFEDHFYDSKFAGLALAAYNVACTK